MHVERKVLSISSAGIRVALTESSLYSISSIFVSVRKLCSREVCDVPDVKSQGVKSQGQRDFGRTQYSRVT